MIMIILIPSTDLLVHCIALSLHSTDSLHCTMNQLEGVFEEEERVGVILDFP